MEVSIQEKLLNTLEKSTRDSLIQSQLAEASGILLRQGQYFANWSLITLNLNTVNPTQHGEDYENPSSNADAAQYEKVLKNSFEIAELRLNSFRPICVEVGSLKIIDGNHRHYAIKKCGEKLIYALLCDVEKISK